MAYYVICDDDSKHEGLTKEQILSAIAQAIENGNIGNIDAEAPFVTKIKEMNAGQAISFWVGTQAQYNALTERAQNCLYIFTDETTKDDLDKLVEDLQAYIEAAQAAKATADAAKETATNAWSLAETNEQNISTLQNNALGIFDSQLTLKSNETSGVGFGGYEVKLVFVSARKSGSNDIMTGVWTPATSGLRCGVGSWDTTVTINDGSVDITNGSAETLTYYVTTLTKNGGSSGGGGGSITPDA